MDDNQFWDNCQKSIERSLKCFSDAGIEFDEIGLLEPTKADKIKYRLYSENDLEKLQQILFYREVGFSLKEIKALLSKIRNLTEDCIACHLVEHQKNFLHHIATLID